MNTYFEEKIVKYRYGEREKKRISAGRILLLFSLISLAAGLIVWKETVKNSVISACNMCLKSLIPAIFPFMVLSEIFIRTFSSKKAPLISAFLIGNICGFPIGAKILSDLFDGGRITFRQYRRFLPLCSNPGLAFTVVGVGSNLWNSYIIGAVLYAVTVFSGAAVFLLFYPKNSDSIEPRTRLSTKNPPLSHTDFSQTFVSSVTGGTEKMIKVCGFVIFFSVLNSVAVELFASLGIPDVFSALFCSFFEISGATASLTELAGNGSSLPLCLALTFFSHGFGGLCIYAQILSVSSGSENVMKNYLSFKLIQGLFCALIAFALMRFLIPITPL